MVRIQRFPQGTRVRIRRGAFPLDPELVGRSGTVVLLKRSQGRKYGVQLDEEDQIRVFTQEELEPERLAGSFEEGGEPAGGGGSAVPG